MPLLRRRRKRSGSERMLSRRRLQPPRRRLKQSPSIRPSNRPSNLQSPWHKLPPRRRRCRHSLLRLLAPPGRRYPRRQQLHPLRRRRRPRRRRRATAATGQHCSGRSTPTVSRSRTNQEGSRSAHSPLACSCAEDPPGMGAPACPVRLSHRPVAAPAMAAPRRCRRHPRLARAARRCSIR